MSLALVTSFSLFTLGVIKNPTKQNDNFNVFEELDRLKRKVASVNHEIDHFDENNENSVRINPDTGVNADATTHRFEEKMGHMALVSGSTVKSMFEANCYFDVLEKTVDSGQVKFDFIDCLPNDRQMKLINRTNGYEAQIFPSRGKKVSSDFIQLQQGENQLVLEISSTPGQIKSQIIKINRIK
jgi:hypothetical protein